jgi:hypothetical protein
MSPQRKWAGVQAIVSTYHAIVSCQELRALLAAVRQKVVEPAVSDAPIG